VLREAAIVSKSNHATWFGDLELTNLDYGLHEAIAAFVLFTPIIQLSGENATDYPF